LAVCLPYLLISFPRLNYGQSYFDILPPDLGDKIVKYATACKCTKDKNDADQVCQNAFSAAFPTVMKKNLSPMQLCDRQKRDVHFSDDPTEEDFQMFKDTVSQLQPRFRRAVQAGHLSKKNATRYCEERISETEIGKLCVTIGVNVQGLVDACAADVEVRQSQVILARILVLVSMRIFDTFRMIYFKYTRTLI